MKSISIKFDQILIKLNQFTCSLQFVAGFGVEPLKQDSDVLVQLVPVPEKGSEKIK